MQLVRACVRRWGVAHNMRASRHSSFPTRQDRRLMPPPSVCPHGANATPKSGKYRGIVTELTSSIILEPCRMNGRMKKSSFSPRPYHFTPPNTHTHTEYTPKTRARSSSNGNTTHTQKPTHICAPCCCCCCCCRTDVAMRRVRLGVKRVLTVDLYVSTQCGRAASSSASSLSPASAVSMRAHVCVCVS